MERHLLDAHRSSCKGNQKSRSHRPKYRSSFPLSLLRSDPPCSSILTPKLASRIPRCRSPFQSRQNGEHTTPVRDIQSHSAAGDKEAPGRWSYILRQHCVAIGKLSNCAVEPLASTGTTEHSAASTTTSAIGAEHARRYHKTKSLTNALLLSSP